MMRKILVISVWKGNYSFEILKETEEFVLCVPTKEMLHEVWFCGTKSGKEVVSYACGWKKVCKLRKTLGFLDEIFK